MNVQALDDLDEPLQTELTDTIDAFIAFYLTAETAYGPATPLGDHGAVFTARNHLLDAVGDLHTAIDAGGATVSSQITVAPFLAVDLDGADSTYTEDIVLVIDAGGNDTYHNNAGGNHQSFSPAAALVDLGNGDDAYGNAESLREDGVNGGGDEGAGVLVDAGGNDTYDAHEEGVNGGGHLGGSGFLLDLAGNDTYGTLTDDGNYPTKWGANGGGGGARGAGGAGTLVDVAGDDDYRAFSRGVNGGGNDASSGLLVDLAGNDNYTAFHRGTNGGVGLTTKYSFPGGFDAFPDLPVSQGLLFDANGTDRYKDTFTIRKTPSGTEAVYDKTYVPKGGVVGAQVDADDPPGGDPS